MRNTLCQLLLATTLVACATATQSIDRQIAADATEGKFTLAGFEWDGEVSAGDKVSVVNRYGDLRVRSAIDKHVVVSAQIQRFAGDDRDIEVSVDQADGAVRVQVREIVLPGDRAAAGTERGTNGRFDGRVDMALLLPHAAPLSAETFSGLLHVKGYKGEATLTTDSGKILASSSTAIVAHADSGEVRVGFNGSNWSRTAKITSRSGQIMVTVPRKANLSIEARSRGEITTKLKGAVEHNKNSASATLGDGSGQLSIRSATGTIEIRQASMN